MKAELVRRPRNQKKGWKLRPAVRAAPAAGPATAMAVRRNSRVVCAAITSECPRRLYNGSVVSFPRVHSERQLAVRKRKEPSFSAAILQLIRPAGGRVPSSDPNNIRNRGAGEMKFGRDCLSLSQIPPAAAHLMWPLTGFAIGTIYRRHRITPEQDIREALERTHAAIAQDKERRIVTISEAKEASR
jgi:hypothetical protein